MINMSTFSTSYETLEKKKRENDVPNEEKMQKNTLILLVGVLQFLSFFICFFGIY